MISQLDRDKVACNSPHKQEPICGNCKRNVDMSYIDEYEWDNNFKIKDGKCYGYIKQAFKIKKKANKT